MKQSLLWCIGLVISLPIVGCSQAQEPSSDSNNSTNDSQVVAEPLDISYEGMQSGDYELTLAGDLTSVEGYSGDMSPVEFEPHPDGNNTSGPREFMLMTDIQTGDVFDGTQARVYILLPDGIQAGTYEVLPRDRDNAGQVQIEIDSGESFGFEFDDEVSGTLTITEIGDTITAGFEITAVGEQMNDTFTVEASGRAYQIPFEFRPQIIANFSGLVTETYDFQAALVSDDVDRHSYQFKYDDFTKEYNLNLVLTNEDFTRLLEIDFWLVSDIQADTHSVVARNRTDSGIYIPEGETVGARIGIKDEANGLDFVTDSIIGTFTYGLNERDAVMGSFEITGTNSETGETVTISGSFDHLPNIFEQ